MATVKDSIGALTIRAKRTAEAYAESAFDLNLKACELDENNQSYDDDGRSYTEIMDEIEFCEELRDIHRYYASCLEAILSQFEQEVSA